MTQSELSIYTFIDDDLLMDICDTKKRIRRRKQRAFFACCKFK